jgi:hypothetical protein
MSELPPRITSIGTPASVSYSFQSEGIGRSMSTLASVRAKRTS